MTSDSGLPKDFAARFDEFERQRVTLDSATGANEATTRLRAIDVLLFDVLGWDRTQAEAEKHYRREGYADYWLTTGHGVELIVEAKKHGVEFALTGRIYGDEAVGFGLLETECHDAAQALRQALGYAVSAGARYVAISNGHQWLLCLVYVEAQPIEERSVLVFESLDAIKRRFASFMQTFSPTAVASNAPSDRLLEPRRKHAPTKLSASIVGYPRPATRNIIANELALILGNVWGELARAESSIEFLRQCYVLPSASAGAMNVAADLLAAYRFRGIEAPDRLVSSAEALRVIRSPTNERPILVLGRVGHGKSTFLRYLRLVQAKEALADYIQLDIDILDRPDSASAVPAYIYDQVELQLLERYGIDITADRNVRGYLDSELRRFAQSPRGKVYPAESAEYKRAEVEFIESQTGDRHRFLGRVMHHLKHGQQKSLVLFIDNLDRRLLPIQDEALLRASAIARDWDCVVFVCLRPDTFYRSKTEGVLDSLAPTTVSIASPDPATLLKKRFEFAVQVARGETGIGHGVLGKGGSAVALELPTAAEFLECCKESFWRGRDLVALFDAVSNGNTRDLLRYVREFLVSNHLDTRKILARISGGYRVPAHEALRSILFGDFLDYSPDRSRFVNLFDVEFADRREHFLRLLLLNFLLGVARASAISGQFVSVKDVRQYLSSLGFSVRSTDSAMRYLLKRELLVDEADFVGKDSDASESFAETTRLRVTALGRYHVTVLVYEFSYIDAVVIDTPIIDQQVRGFISDETDIVYRLDRADHFLDYLMASCESLKDQAAKDMWQPIDRSLSDEIEAIRRRVGAPR